MAYKSREFSIDLERDEQTQWGIRLVGGSDLNTPLIITKVPRTDYIVIDIAILSTSNLKLWHL